MCRCQVDHTERCHPGNGACDCKPGYQGKHCTESKYQNYTRKLGWPNFFICDKQCSEQVEKLKTFLNLNKCTELGDEVVDRREDAFLTDFSGLAWKNKRARCFVGLIVCLINFLLESSFAWLFIFVCFFSCFHKFSHICNSCEDWILLRLLFWDLKPLMKTERKLEWKTKRNISIKQNVYGRHTKVFVY